ncbi:MAG: chromosomal replication initiator DnaA [Rhodobacteraceae bacterium]|nr:chromosomal replication initiator DnaA [Paracoccaceae bacterium]
MIEQMVFDLPPDTAFGRDDFLVSEANSAAVARIEAWRNWPQNKLVLSGPAGSGKSHLARIWTEAAGATAIPATELPGADLTALAGTWAGVAVEDVHEAGPEAQRALFHLHNLCGQDARLLLMTGRGNSAAWAGALPDLASRIAAALEVRVGAPDENLLGALFVKLFDDRQLQVAPHVLRQMLLHSERSFAFVMELVNRLDKFALAKKSGVTRKLVSDVFKEMRQEDGQTAP